MLERDCILILIVISGWKIFNHEIPLECFAGVVAEYQFGSQGSIDKIA
jgi:hypothetical protein